MGGSVGGGQSQSSSQNIQNSVFSPPPWTVAAGQQAVQAAQSLAQMPFEIPQQPIAPLQPQQSEAFQTVENLQGAFTPYLEAGLNAGMPRAANFVQQGSQNPFTMPAAALQTFPGASQYFAGEAAGVVPELENIFGQQAAQNVGNLVQQAGGIGADRIGVGQAELANQQGLAAGQTLSQLMGQAVTQGQTAGTNLANIGAENAQLLQSAGTNTGNLAQAAGSLANLGQTMGLTGAQAELNAGNLQQQQLQNQMNAVYSNDLQAISWPFQTNEYLGALTSGITPSMGGSGISSGIQNVQSSSLQGSAGGSGKGMMSALGGGKGMSAGGRALAREEAALRAHGGRVPYAGGGVTFMGALDGAPSGSLGNPYQNPWQRISALAPQNNNPAGSSTSMAGSTTSKQPGFAPGGSVQHGSPMQKGGSAPGGVQGPGNMPGQSLAADQAGTTGSMGFAQQVSLPGGNMGGNSAYGDATAPADFTLGVNDLGWNATGFIDEATYQPNGPMGPGFYNNLNGSFMGTVPPPAAPPPIQLVFPTTPSYAQNAGAPVLPNRNPTLGGNGPIPFTNNGPYLQTAYNINTGNPQGSQQYINAMDAAYGHNLTGLGTGNDVIPQPNGSPTSLAANTPFSSLSYAGSGGPGANQPGNNGMVPNSGGLSGNVAATISGGIVPNNRQYDPNAHQAFWDQLMLEPQALGNTQQQLLANQPSGQAQQTGFGQFQPTAMYSQMLSGLLNERDALSQMSQFPTSGGFGASAATQAAPTFGANNFGNNLGALFGGGGGWGGNWGNANTPFSFEQVLGGTGGGSPFGGFNPQGRSPFIPAGSPQPPAASQANIPRGVPTPPNVSSHAEGGRANGRAKGRGEVEPNSGRPIKAPPGFYDSLLPNFTDLAGHARWDNFERSARPSQNIEDERGMQSGGNAGPMYIQEWTPGAMSVNESTFDQMAAQGLVAPGFHGGMGMTNLTRIPQQAPPAPPPPPAAAPVLANPNIGNTPAGGVGNGVTAANQAAPTFGTANLPTSGKGSNSGLAAPTGTMANPMSTGPMGSMGGSLSSMANNWMGNAGGGSGNKGSGTGMGMGWQRGGRVPMQTGGVPGKGSAGTSMGGTGTISPQQSEWNALTSAGGMQNVNLSPTPWGNGLFEALGGVSGWENNLPQTTPQGSSALQQPFNNYTSWSGTNGMTPASPPPTGSGVTGNAWGLGGQGQSPFSGTNAFMNNANLNNTGLFGGVGLPNPWAAAGGYGGMWERGGRARAQTGGAQQTDLISGGINPSGSSIGSGSGMPNFTAGDPTSLGGNGPIASAMSTPIKPGPGSGLAMAEKMNQAGQQANQQAAAAASKPGGGGGQSPGGGGGKPGGGKPGGGKPQQSGQPQSQGTPSAPAGGQPPQQGTPGGLGTINPNPIPNSTPMGPSPDAFSPFQAGPVSSATPGAPGGSAMAMPGMSGSPFNAAAAANPQMGMQEVASMGQAAQTADASAMQDMGDMGGGAGGAGGDQMAGDMGGGGGGDFGGDFGGFGGGFGYRGGRFSAGGDAAAHAVRLARRGHYDDGGDVGDGGGDIGSSGSDVSDIQPQLGDHGGSQTFASMPPPNPIQGTPLNAQNTHGSVNWADVPKPNPVSTIAEAPQKSGSFPNANNAPQMGLPSSRPSTPFDLTDSASRKAANVPTPLRTAQAGQSDAPLMAAATPAQSPFVPTQQTPNMAIPQNGPQNIRVTQPGQTPAANIALNARVPQNVQTWINNALAQPNIDPAITPEYMAAIGNIESGFDPTNRTGQYHGLYQMGTNGDPSTGGDEWARYGNGRDISNGQDNANAYARMASDHAAQLRAAGIPVTPQNLYMVHQQGLGAVTSGQATHHNMVGNNPGGFDTRNFGNFSNAWGQRINGLIQQYTAPIGGQAVNPSIGESQGGVVGRALRVAHR